MMSSSSECVLSLGFGNLFVPLIFVTSYWDEVDRGPKSMNATWLLIFMSISSDIPSATAIPLGRSDWH